MIQTWIIAVVFGHGMAYIPQQYPTEEFCKIAAEDYMARYGASTQKFFADAPAPRGAYCQSVLYKTKGP